MKNKIFLTAANAFFAFTAGAVILLNYNLSKYKNNLLEKIYIAAYTDDTGHLRKIAGKIRSAKGVRKAVVLTPEKVMASFGDRLTGGNLLDRVGGITAPAVIKIYASGRDFESFLETSRNVSAIAGVKFTDDGGIAVRKIFLFLDKLQTSAESIIVILLAACAIAFFETVSEGRNQIGGKIRFLRERVYDRKTAVIKNLSAIVLVPLVATLAAVFVLYVIWHQTVSDYSLFLTNAQAAALFSLSFLPWLLIIFRK